MKSDEGMPAHPLRVLQSAERFKVVIAGGRQGRDHDRLGVATERNFQQLGKDGFAIGDFLGSFLQGIDHLRGDKGLRLV